jgi:hypothetical protein
LGNVHLVTMSSALGGPSSPDELLWAIAASSSPLTLPSDRQRAFTVIEGFKQGSSNDGAMAVCLQWLVQGDPIHFSSSSSLSSIGQGSQDTVNITVPVKLLACEVITKFLKQSYSTIGEVDRLQLRQAVLTACQQVVLASKRGATVMALSQAESTLSPSEARILARTLAAVLQGLVIRGESK